jgi:low temperature requirement protein LtrA
VASESASAAAERATTPVELLWDLVFVFAVTQVTTHPGLRVGVELGLPIVRWVQRWDTQVTEAR